MLVINIYVLVHNRAEFTNLALRYLYQFTNFDCVNRLVFVDDRSEDGAKRVILKWIRDTGIGEYVYVEAGTVTNALFLGSAQSADDDVVFAAKLDNDMIVCEGWLDIMLDVTDRHPRFDIYGFTTVNEFFSTDELWKKHHYSIHPTPYTGGNFLMQWDTFLQTRGLGYVEKPKNYIEGSIDGLHRSLTRQGKLSCCVIRPHLPVFKLDKVLARQYDKYEFLEKRGIDKEWVAEKTNEYFRRGWCRKRFVNGQVVNAF